MLESVARNQQDLSPSNKEFSSEIEILQHVEREATLFAQPGGQAVASVNPSFRRESLLQSPQHSDMLHDYHTSINRLHAIHVHG